MKKLLIVDGNSIINRAFYGIRPLTNSRGEQTNAIYGTVNMIARQIRALDPDYAAVAFDVHHPTFRHTLYPEYKAGRRPTPPELLEQFDGCKACLSAMGLATLELPGYEADDIQGTLAKLASRTPDTEAYVLSGDRDLLQLIDEHVTVLLAGNTETVPYRRDNFRNRFGIEVEQYLDLKALQGDSSDNIPGVPGIGEKTAVKLLTDYHDLDGIFAHKEDPALTPSLRRKLTEGEASGRLSRTLVTIDTNTPIGVTLADIAYRGADNDKLFSLFTRYEFTALIRQFKLFPPEESTCAPSDEKSEEAPSIPAASYSEIPPSELASRIPPRFAISETEGGFAFASQNGSFLCTCPPDALAPLFLRDGLCICHDMKRLLHILHRAGIAPSVAFYDVMLAGYLLHAGDNRSGIAPLAMTHLGQSLPDDVPHAHLLLPLADVLDQKLTEIGAHSLLHDVELPLAHVLAEMEETGFRVDRAGLLSIGAYLGEEAARVEREIYASVGHSFNIASPKQLGEVLFSELGLPGGKKTKTGYSTNAEVLESLRDAHPVVSLVLEYRQLTKLKSTYADGLLTALDENDLIHTDFKQALTATGRLSSAEPNLQNIPVRTELGRLFRTLFIAGKGRVLVDADYSQIELRLLAHIANDEAMLSAFASGVDIHRTTAAEVFRIPVEMVTNEMRLSAKAVNFGIMYGIGPYSLSRDLGIPMGEAKHYIESYKASYPGIAEYLDRVIREAREKGYTTTLFGRRRLIPELASTNKMTQAFGARIAMNSPIQGSSADIMKIAMVRTHRALREEVPSARIVMQVHDELIVECDERDAQRVASILKREMEGAAPLSLPLSVEVALGTSWAAK